MGEGDGIGFGFEAARYPTLDEFCFRPVIAGMWQQCQVFDGTYDFVDLLDAHELLDVKDENERRVREWVKAHQGDK